MASRNPKSISVKPGRRVAELFAGVGGFRLGLEGLDHPNWPDWEGREGAGWNVVWSNQWEPSTKVQHASDCYVSRFGPVGHECRDIALVVEEAERNSKRLPDFDLLVGGFPCQDYSVAKVLSQAAGINGKKGALWWQIHKMLELKQPSFVMLENVDRLLKSPADQRGRDFAIILWCLNHLGYFAEWRVVNAADYGFAQRRRRVFIVAHKLTEMTNPYDWLMKDGVLARSLPIEPTLIAPSFRIDDDYLVGARHDLNSELVALTERFGVGDKRSRFLTGGVMWKGEVVTDQVAPIKEPSITLGEILLPASEVPKEYYIPKEQLPRWEYLKGSKKEERNGTEGFTYFYNEGPVAFPDRLDTPSRTILTGEGGSGASRFKHVVKQRRRGLRRLTPVELERLNGFPDGWTQGMPDSRRAFMMGNALVVGLVRRIAQAL